MSTPERRATLIANEVTHVQNCHYDGTTIDLETGPYQGQESMYFNYFNDEATAMRLIGKTLCPEIGAPAGLWQGNLDSNCQNFVSKLSGIDALNFGDSTNLGAGEWVCNIAGQEGNPGYIPTLMEFIQYCNVPIVINTGYDILQWCIKYENDLVFAYGPQPKIVGHSIYDYVAGIGPDKQYYPRVAAPIGYFNNN